MAENFGINLSDYNFDLPEYLIAQKPAIKRDSSKLLIYDRKKDTILHKNFSDIFNYFSFDDALILNNSKVIPAKLIGTNILNHKKIDIVLVEELSSTENFIEFSVITKISKLKINQIFEFPENIKAEFVSRNDDLAVFRFFLTKTNFYLFLDKYGKMPLPPYIKRENDFLDDNDKNSYQTVYAKNLGSIAAPTAGLHFTDDILKKIADNGALVKHITLHVGMGTFKPIKTENIQEHKMLPERYEISDEIVNLLQNKTKNITSVGTTTTRTIESFFINQQNTGATDLYINPGHKFHIDRLITNFHVPKSTPLMLLTAFIADGVRDAGESKYIPKSIEILKKIYAEAIKKEYRFYSYGDSMFVI
jgi:S-adenosylmethionine:tRNA ribosyltransferase-isomerase